MIMNSPQAVVVSKGNGDSAWIKGQLTSTQEEVFIYPDDDKTIDVKALPIGSGATPTPGKMIWVLFLISEFLFEIIDLIFK